MINKYFKVVKKYIKENYVSLIVQALIILVIFFPVDNYYILTSGGITSLSKRINIENRQVNDDLYMAYVNQMNATIGYSLASFIIKDWDLEKLTTGDSLEDDDKRSKVWIDNSVDIATIVAYKAAGKDLDISNLRLSILYIDAKADTTLEIADEIIEVDGVSVKTIDDYKKVINSKKALDIVELKVINNNEIFYRKALIYEEDNRLITGISIVSNYDYEVEPKLELELKANESGPSGGMMMTLGIYNRLIDKPLLLGKKVVGTGTINEEGLIGQIDGIKYKFKAAVKAKADIFIAPSGDNYHECLELKKKLKSNIRVIEATTFTNLINTLENDSQK